MIASRHSVRVVVLGIICVAGTVEQTGGVVAAEMARPTDYIAVVRAYADCLIERGKDTYGAVHSPLFAETLDRHTLRLLEGAALEKVAALKFEDWGIRPHDRMLSSANPMHCEDFYQVLYALTEATGQPKYAAAADQSLKFFFEHCQSEATGLYYWGEHAGWDLLKDKPMEGSAATLHEFYRPWVLWDRCYELAPEPCRKFALGLWEHQIGDHKTGDFSRHARIDRHGPGTDAPYARHGGFYIGTWAKAYQRTHDAVFLKAIETVLNGLESARRSGGMLVGGSKTRGSRTLYDLSLAISLEDTAALVPPDLAAKLRAAATANDGSAAEPIKPASFLAAPEPSRQNLWSAGYGRSGGEIASYACTRMLRYRQNKLPAHRTAVLNAADQYLADETNLSYPVHPGTLGKVILLLLHAHELTSQDRYLRRADDLARQAITLFLDACPLPKASHVHDHYEAVTGADTLMMSLLELWSQQQKPPRRLPLVFTDR